MLFKKELSKFNFDMDKMEKRHEQSYCQNQTEILKGITALQNEQKKFDSNWQSIRKK